MTLFEHLPLEYKRGRRRTRPKYKPFNTVDISTSIEGWNEYLFKRDDLYTLEDVNGTYLRYYKTFLNRYYEVITKNADGKLLYMPHNSNSYNIAQLARAAKSARMQLTILSKADTPVLKYAEEQGAIIDNKSKISSLFGFFLIRDDHLDTMQKAIKNEVEYLANIGTLIISVDQGNIAKAIISLLKNPPNKVYMIQVTGNQTISDKLAQISPVTKQMVFLDFENVYHKEVILSFDNLTLDPIIEAKAVSYFIDRPELLDIKPVCFWLARNSSKLRSDYV